MAALLAFHWVPFAVVWAALRRNGEPWSSIGVDWGWFVRRKYWVGGVLLVLAAAAFAAPAGEPPALVRLRVYSNRGVEVSSRHALSGL